MTQTAAATPKLDVFLSYKREERDVAEALARFLITRGYDVWWDAALLAGEDFAKIVHAELSEARAVVVLWSKLARTSHWVRAEAAIAHANGTLINAVIDDMAFEGIPPEYSGVQAVRLGADVAAFHAAIAAAIAHKGTAPSQTGRSVAEAVATLEGKVKDAEFFGVISTSSQVVDFEEYLQRFGPQAQFATMAKRRIEYLRREENKRKSLLTRLKAAGAALVLILGAGVSIEQLFGVRFAHLLGFQPNEEETPPITTPESGEPVDPSGQVLDSGGLVPNLNTRPTLGIPCEGGVSQAMRALTSTATVQCGEVAVYEWLPPDSIRNENYGTVAWSGDFAYTAEITFHTGGTATLTLSPSMYNFMPPSLELTFSDYGIALDGLTAITGLRADNTDIPIITGDTPSLQVSLDSAGRDDGSYQKLLSADALTLLLAFTEGTIGTFEISKAPDDERLRAILFPPVTAFESPPPANP